MYTLQDAKSVPTEDLKRVLQCCIEENVEYMRGSLHVRAVLSSESRTELVLIENGILNVKINIEEILNEHVGQFVVNMG